MRTTCRAAVATGDDDLGRTAIIQHKTNTGTTPPIRQSVRRMPQLRRQEAKKCVQTTSAWDSDCGQHALTTEMHSD